MEIEFTNAPETVEEGEVNEEVNQTPEVNKEVNQTPEVNEEVIEEAKEPAHTEEETNEAVQEVQKEPEEVKQETSTIPSEESSNSNETIPASRIQPRVPITLASLESLPSVPTTAPVVIESEDSDVMEAKAECS